MTSRPRKEVQRVLSKESAIGVALVTELFVSGLDLCADYLSISVEVVESQFSAIVRDRKSAAGGI